MYNSMRCRYWDRYSILLFGFLHNRVSCLVRFHHDAIIDLPVSIDRHWIGKFRNYTKVKREILFTGLFADPDDFTFHLPTLSSKSVYFDFFFASRAYALTLPSDESFHKPSPAQEIPMASIGKSGAFFRIKLS